jgi:DNA polymerase elongation subunit (family B)
VANTEEEKNTYRVLMEKSEGERLLVRQEGNNRMDLKGIGSVDMDWIHLAQDRSQL